MFMLCLRIMRVVVPGSGTVRIARVCCRPGVSVASARTHGSGLNEAADPAPSALPGRPSPPAGAVAVIASSRSRGVSTASPAPGSKYSLRQPGRPSGSRGTRVRAPSRLQRRREALRSSGKGKQAAPSFAGLGLTRRHSPSRSVAFRINAGGGFAPHRACGKFFHIVQLLRVLPT
ncbi:hypothetical protein NDU88_001329 [Pleurodeles waltl]|uniref:Uncharacterized protein n=1 Tax=Pleurodeles waltl TaxID=8319 RepID=A0AAV7U9V7_PLEWA|nr:hypothetical protein NDU88_001329 [Pleurodeles waltl]